MPFQSTLPRRKRRLKSCVNSTRSYFNPRFREGSDIQPYCRCQEYGWFQSTLPRRKRLKRVVLPEPFLPFQSTLPRRKRQNPSSACLRHWYDFNPRFREGSDSNTVIKTDLGVTISIHASAKEATESNYSAALPVLFHSTLPRRKRLALNRFDHVVTDFNPRFREGSDYMRSQAVVFMFNFNPRFREGSDDIAYAFNDSFLTISIHASAKEATNENLKPVRTKSISIHASAKEATADMYNFLVYICKNHSTTYKLIIILLFHTVKQIKYSYWKKCESICIFMYTCDSHLTLSGIICIHPFHHWLRFDGENLVYYEAIINQYSTPKS